MSYKKNRPKREPWFAMIEFKMLDSWAWRKLSPHGVKAYIALLRKYNGRNGNDLSLTYKEAEEIMNRHTFRKVILELMELGFIERIRKGGARYNNKAECNIFALSERWKLVAENTNPGCSAKDFVSEARKAMDSS